MKPATNICRHMLTSQGRVSKKGEEDLEKSAERRARVRGQRERTHVVAMLLQCCRNLGQPWVEVLLGASWGLLGVSWESSGTLGRPSGSYFSELGALLGPLDALLRSLGALLGSLASLLGGSWEHFGAILEHVGPDF